MKHPLLSFWYRGAVPVFLFTFLAACALPAPSGDPATGSYGRIASTAKGTRSLATGLGRTFEPATTALHLAMHYAPWDHFTLGPEVLLGLDEDRFLLAPVITLKNTFKPPLAALTGCLAHLEGGLGFVYMDRDRAGGTPSDDDTAFLVSIGGGLEYPLQEDVTLVSTLKLQHAPGGVLDQHTWVSWEMLGLKFYF